MPYCSNCRTYIPDGVDTCPKCGTKDARYTSAPPPTQSTSYGQQNIPKARKPFVELIKIIFKTEDITYGFNSSDISTNSNNAVLSYLGPLVLIPLITSRKSKFAMFHCCQGLMNTVFGVLYVLVVPVIFNILPDLITLFLLIPYFVFLVVFPVSLVLGVVHALKGKAITLPVFGRIDLMRVLFKNL